MLWLVKGLGRGGAEQLLCLSAPHVDPSRYAIDVAYVLPHKDALVPAVREAGVAVLCLGDGGRGTWPLRLRRLVVDGDYDVVHTHSPVVAAAARAALRPPAPVLVHTEHNVWQRYRWATRIANAVTYGRNAAVLAVSSGVAASIRPPAWARSVPVEVLHHGIDGRRVRRGEGARAAARGRLGLADEQVALVTVGNLTPKKDQRALLRAFAGLPDTAVTLHLIGSGPLEAELRGQASTLGLEDRVRFLGLRDDVQELLPAYDLFVLSSRHEGFPIALLEAMAAGLPVVATRVGGVPELVVDGDTGVLVDAGDVEQLRGAIARLLLDAPTRARLSRRGADVAAQHTIGATVERIVALYDEVLGR